MFSKKRAGNEGSASVEAMLVVPLFLFAVLGFIYICNVIAVQSIVYEASIQTAEYMAEYAYLMEQNPEGMAQASQTVATIKFRDYLDDYEKADRLIVNGVNGVSFSGSEFPDEEGYIVLHVRYQVFVNIPFICNLKKECKEDIRQKAYLGYQKKDTEESETEEEYVYVAEQGQVYHAKRSCSYLAPDISVSNKNSAIETGYSPCEYCGSAAKNTVYITGEGDRYHSTYSCSRLRRTVYRKKLSEIGGMPPCQRCY